MPRDIEEGAEKDEAHDPATARAYDGDTWIKGLSFRAERWACLFLHLALVLGFATLSALSSTKYFYVGDFYIPYQEYGEKGANISAVTFGASTVPLFLGLIYTAVLVGFTQRLSLRNALMSRQRLVVTHDKANAWFGLGSCATVLRRQFQVRSSIGGILLITLYLAAITIVHTISGSIFYLYYDPDTASDAVNYSVYIYISKESSSVGIAASFAALLFCALLTRPPSKVDTDNFRAIDEADKLYSFGLLQVIRLMRNKPEVQKRMGEAENSSDACLRDAAKSIEVQLMGGADV